MSKAEDMAEAAFKRLERINEPVQLCDLQAFEKGLTNRLDQMDQKLDALADGQKKIADVLDDHGNRLDHLETKQPAAH